MCAEPDIFVSLPYFKKFSAKIHIFLRKGKARACESLGFVVNKNEIFFFRVRGKMKK